jgi:hypothetical protein
MPSSTWRRAATAAAVLALALVGCRRGSAGKGAADESPDAGRDAEAALAFDAEPPPDDAVPSSSTDELATRARHLLEAITKDDPSQALDILFPRDAWIATRDSADAGKDWARRVAAPFRRAVHALSRRRVAADAQFVSL